MKGLLSLLFSVAAIVAAVLSGVYFVGWLRFHAVDTQHGEILKLLLSVFFAVVCVACTSGAVITRLWGRKA